MAIREHTGLFVERAPRRYGFMHLTFEEYYVARYLVARSRTRAKLIRQHLHQPRWEEPILLALGFVGLEYSAEASELVETAILALGEEAQELEFTSSPFEEWLGRDFLFALRCLGDNIPIHTRLVRRLMERLANELLYGIGAGRYQRYRVALTEQLNNLRDSEGGAILLPTLATALQDTDDEVRFRAAQSLWQLGQVATPGVIHVLALHDASDELYLRVAQSLWRLSQVATPAAIDALASALNDADTRVRLFAVQSLGQLGQADTP